MKKTLLVLIALTITTLTGCRDNAHVNEIFLQADSLMAEHPDSAYNMLLTVEPEVQACPERQKMRYELLRAKAQNKAFVDFTTDSIMLLVADYYDHHGTPNDRLMAHYLLGCTYRDMGEAPRAIDSYQTAIACADTTDSECDYATLGCLYSQMAEIHHNQMLFMNEAMYRQSSFMYATKCKDFKSAAYELCMLGCVFILQNQTKMAEDYFLDAKKLYEDYGFHQEWVERSNMLAHLYLSDTPKLQQAEEILNIYEKESVYINGKGELPPLKRKFFGYKGMLFEKKNQLDSAEYYIRKVGDEYKEMMYRSLLHIYQQRHNADSVAKYAQLYCEANDSSVIITDRELTAKMAASYKYNRYLKEANIQQARAARTTLWLCVSLSVTLLIIIVTLCLCYRYRQRKEKLKRLLLEYANTRQEYALTRQELEEEMISYQQLYEFLHNELENASTKTDRLQTRNSELQDKLENLTTRHENSVSNYQQKITLLESKINELIHHGAIAQVEKQSREFRETAIAQRMLTIAHDPRLDVTAEEWKQLTIEAESYYPELLHDLHTNPNISPNALHVALLLVLQLHTGEISNMMQVNSSRISNIKGELNRLLFQDKGAATLGKHLAERYNIYT